MKFLVCVGLTMFLYSCSEHAESNKVKMMQADTLLYTQEGTNVTIRYTDSGRLKAKIFAKKLIGYKKDGDDLVRMPLGITGEFYSDSGRVESSLTAEYGFSNQSKKITEVTRNVQVMNSKGEKLQTEKLIWDQKKETIHTDKFVKITTKDEILTGEGMESKQDFSNWVIKKPRGVITLQKDSTANN